MTLFEFRLPDVGEGIAEAEVIDWLVAVGDSVTLDQPIAVVETDKSQLELPIPVAGVVRALHGKPGDVLKVGAVLISVETTGEVPIDSGHGGHGTSQQTTQNAPTTAATAASQVVASAEQMLGRVQSSPSTRKLAASLGIDLRAVAGTGPHGRITEDDVRAATSNKSSQVRHQSAPSTAASASTMAIGKVSGPSTSRGLHGVRRAIAASMSASLSVPDIMEFREIDASELLVARDALRESAGEKVSVTPLLIKAVTLALQQHPNMNARFDGETIVEYQNVHVGIATATDDGLLVPVLHDAQSVAIRDLPGTIERLVNAAKSRTATPDELGGGTFTVTNFGSFGTWLGTPIIRVPEVAIAGFGRISDKVIALDGLPVVRPVLPVVVATDHRVNDGAHLGAFVTTLEQLLRTPQEWMS